MSRCGCCSSGSLHSPAHSLHQSEGGGMGWGCLWHVGPAVCTCGDTSSTAVCARSPPWEHTQAHCWTAPGPRSCCSFTGLSGKGLGRMQPWMWVPEPGQAHVSPPWCRSTISPMGTWCQPGMSPQQQGWVCVCTNVWFIKAFFETLALGFRLHQVAPARPRAALAPAAPRNTIQKVQTSKNRNCSTMCKNK